jgi:hypothetical protein
LQHTVDLLFGSHVDSVERVPHVEEPKSLVGGYRPAQCYACLMPLAKLQKEFAS